jgi:hypothetical protein
MKKPEAEHQNPNPKKKTLKTQKPLFDPHVVCEEQKKEPGSLLFRERFYVTNKTPHTPTYTGTIPNDVDRKKRKNIRRR